jgi:ubiquinone/menaquinone biosynthesis C-methylase UbiE
MPSGGHRWHAALYDRLTKSTEKALVDVRRFVAGEATGRVLEIGCGTGANLPYYDWSRVESLTATDPDPFMLRRAEAKAGDLQAEASVSFHNVPAETLPFPDAAFDTVVATLVLCTVDDVAASLAEVRRVLRPDGVFRFVEHVRGEGLVGGVQDVIEPVWGWFAGGCHPNRRTEASLQDAGFVVQIERRFSLGGLPAIVGVGRA